jgi:kinetochor protein Mis14/NSL1
LTLKVTGLRRDAPANAAENFRQRWTAEEEAFNARANEARKEQEAENMELDVGEFARWDEVQAVYGTSMDGLVKLKTDLTESVAKLERAKGVAAYIESQQRS